MTVDYKVENRQRLSNLKAFIEQSQRATQQLSEISDLLPNIFREESGEAALRRPLTAATAHFRESSVKLQLLQAQLGSSSTNRTTSVRTKKGKKTGLNLKKHRIKPVKRSWAKKRRVFKLGSIKQGQYNGGIYSSQSGRRVGLASSDRNNKRLLSSAGDWNDTVERQQVVLARKIADAEAEFHTYYDYRRQLLEQQLQAAKDSTDNSGSGNKSKGKNTADQVSPNVDQFALLAQAQLEKQERADGETESTDPDQPLVVRDADVADDAKPTTASQDTVSVKLSSEQSSVTDVNKDDNIQSTSDDAPTTSDSANTNTETEKKKAGEVEEEDDDDDDDDDDDHHRRPLW